MFGIARMMDLTIGVCVNNHDPQTEVGFVMTSQVKMLVKGMPAARMTDFAISSDGGVGIIVGGSPKALCAGLPIAQQFSSFVGVYTGYIIGCSPTTMC
jgi:uncharacterized Zn-binding protein involved in type VI secretion